ncbi:MAG: translocation/assembly module TamB [Flavobacteriales bacterium]|nr:translocation/assembly module TamB [Flavobacteriales bacterium]
MLRWLTWLLLLLIVFAVTSVLLLRLATVQTWLAHRLSAYLADRGLACMTVGEVEVTLFDGVRLNEVMLCDMRGDTLIAARSLKLVRWRVDLERHRVHVHELELDGARWYLAQALGDSTSNFTQWIASFGGSDTAAGGAPWVIQCDRFKIHDFAFTHHDANEPVLPFGVDFDHIEVRDAVVEGHDLLVIEDSISAVLEEVRFRERSGLVCEHFSGDAIVSPHGILVDGLRLRTPGSDVRADVRLLSTSWDDHSDFLQKVRLKVELDSSKVRFSDIAFFASELEGMDLEVMAKGEFRGPIAELKGRKVSLWYGDRTRFEGAVELSGLPELANTFIVLDVEQLRTDLADLRTLPTAPFTEGGRLELPEELAALGTMSFRGNFTGFFTSFTAYGSASTAIGALSTDMSYERDTVSRIFAFHGALASEGFDLGPLIGDATLGTMACDLKVNARGRNFAGMQADLEGMVPLLTLNGQAVSGITVNGRLQRDLFNGHLECDDPYLQLTFDGLADLRGRWPKVDFTAAVRHADLFGLRVLPKQHLGEVSFSIDARGELAPDSLKGTLSVKDLTYCDDKGLLELGDAEVSSGRSEGQPVLTLRSSMADAHVRGIFLPTLLPEAFRNVVFSVFPALSEQVEYVQEEQYFDFNIELKAIDSLLNRLVPGLSAGAGATFEGGFDSRTFDLSLGAVLPHFTYGAIKGDSVTLFLDKTLDVLAFSARSDRQHLTDSTYLTGIDITGKAYQDEVILTMGWGGSSGGTHGKLDLRGLVNGPTDVEIDLLPSELHFGLGSWKSQGTTRLHYANDELLVDSLRMRNGEERVEIAGILSKDPEKAIGFLLDGVRLDHLRPFYAGPSLHGTVSGDGRLFDAFGEPYLLSYICLDSLRVADKPVGDIKFAASWHDGRREMDVNGTVQRDTLRALEFTGRIAPGRDREQLDLNLLLDDLDLAFIDPYLPEGVSDIKGELSGTIHVGGMLSEPQVEGTALLKDAGLRIDYLNTFYSFTDEVRVLPDAFWLDLVPLKDQEGHLAKATGTINHKGFSKWDYDVTLEVDRFLCLNTTSLDNELFYGKVYATGDVQVSGYQGNLEVTFDGRTDKGTVIGLPLGSGKDVGGIDYVRFHAGTLDPDTLAAPVDLSGVRLDMNVEVTPDARFELIFDPTVGDILEGSGQGNVTMEVTPAGDLAMWGDVELTTGSYLFTLRNVVNKRFEVEPGGHITWFGDPLDAQLNVNALYKLRAPLIDIIPAERSDALLKRVPVEVIMHLTDRLVNPDIGFDIRLPSVDEGVRTQVNSLVSDPDELNRQVFSLIVLNRFLPVDRLGLANNSTATRGNVVSSSGSELLSNQVSNWLNRLSNDVDLGFNYRPGDDLTQDELEVAVSTQLFNERLVLSTNVGVQYGSTSSQQSNALVGDFMAEYLITDNGRFRFKAFSQSNDRNLNQVDQAATTQGAGLAYRIEFNTVGELWRRLKGSLRSKKERPPAPVNVTSP